MEVESTLRQAVRATVAAKSARIACFSRNGDPVPEDIDITAEGIADLSGYRVLLRRRKGVGTERVRREASTLGGIARLLFRERRRTGSKTRYVIGPQYATLSRRGVWSELYPPRGPDGSLHAPEEIADPEFNEVLSNPLWALKAIARVIGDVEENGAQQPVRGVPTRRLSTVLTAEHMAEHPWRWLGERRGPSERNARRSYEPAPIEVVVWVDAENRIRRISYERGAGYAPDAGEPEPIWEILELWEFGTSIDEAFPS